MPDDVMTYKVPPPEMFDEYETQRPWVPPPPAKDATGATGKWLLYRVTVPTAEAMTFRPDKNGFLMAVIDGFVLEDGYTLRKEYLSSAPFPKKDKHGAVIGTRKASTLGNYFRACGLSVRPGSPEEYESLTLATAGSTFEATIEWEAYDTDTQTTLADRWEAFPQDPRQPQGVKQPFLELPDGKRCWARARIRRYIDAV